MKRNAVIKFDESSLLDTAKALMVMNPGPWKSFKKASDFVEYIKSETYRIMWEEEDKHFTHWGTGGFYVTVFPSSTFPRGKVENPTEFHGHATLMPFTVEKYLEFRGAIK